MCCSYLFYLSAISCDNVNINFNIKYCNYNNCSIFIAQMKTKNKKILIIIGGGISAYKSLDLLRFLKKDGYEIKIVLTRSGKQFVTPLSLVSLSGGKVYENLFEAAKYIEQST